MKIYINDLLLQMQSTVADLTHSPTHWQNSVHLSLQYFGK